MCLMKVGGKISVIWNKTVKGIKDSDKEILRALLPENRKKKDKKFLFPLLWKRVLFYVFFFEIRDWYREVWGRVEGQNLDGRLISITLHFEWGMLLSRIRATIFC